MLFYIGTALILPIFAILIMIYGFQYENIPGVYYSPLNREPSRNIELLFPIKVGTVHMLYFYMCRPHCIGMAMKRSLFGSNCLVKCATLMQQWELCSAADMTCTRFLATVRFLLLLDLHM